jgi:hypothetical protein
MAANAAHSGSDGDVLKSFDILLILLSDHGQAQLLRKPYRESRDRHLLRIRLGTKRILRLETLR